MFGDVQRETSVLHETERMTVAMTTPTPGRRNRAYRADSLYEIPSYAAYRARVRTPLRHIPWQGAVTLPRNVRFMFASSSRTRWHLPTQWTQDGWHYNGPVLCGVEAPRAWGHATGWTHSKRLTLERVFGSLAVCGECLARAGFDRESVRLARASRDLPIPSPSPARKRPGTPLTTSR